MKRPFILAVCLLLTMASYAQDKDLIELLEENPNAIPLDSNDDTRDLRNLRRDPNDNPKREPGPINIQKTLGGTWQTGIPTFFRLPVALGPEDLKAGNVEVALFGAAADLSSGQRGTAYGPMAIRMGDLVGGWGELPVIKTGHPVAGDVDWTQDLVVVDYGDAHVDMLSGEGTILPVYQMASEIYDAGAIPFTVGGDHSLMYPDVAAAAKKYGKGNIAVIHFDAHFDASGSVFGHYISHGGPVKRVIDEGHIKGEDFYQIGLNSSKPGAKDMKWMRENGLKFFFMHEIDTRGWKDVMKEVLDEIEASGKKYVFVSVDTDCLDPAYAPGMGTPEPGGLTIRELFPMLRAVTTGTNVIGLEVVELNPLVDPTYQSRLVGVRIIRELMTGIALRKKGITDPFYVDEDWTKFKKKE